MGRPRRRNHAVAKNWVTSPQRHFVALADTGTYWGGCVAGGSPGRAPRQFGNAGLTSPPAACMISPMPTITTFLTFKDQAEDAARFYTSVFPNSQITRVTRYPDLGPQSPMTPGTVMTVDFTLNGRAFTALNGGPPFEFSNAISIAVQCDTQQEVDEYWDKFVAAGGAPVACGWITDHFGVSWQIDPKVLIDLVSDPDPVRAGKAMQAMMTMVKIDGEQIERAVAQ